MDNYKTRPSRPQSSHSTSTSALNLKPPQQQQQPPLRVSVLKSRLENDAPRPATIISRSPPEFGPPTYDLKIGKVDIPGVSLEELFDYVSPHHLEVFENEAFKNDQRVEENEKLRQRDDAKRLRKLKWIRRKNDVAFSDGNQSSDGSSRNSDDGTTPATDGRERDGRRPRPTYTHLYKKGRAKRVPKDEMEIEPAATTSTLTLTQPTRATGAVKSVIRASSPDVVIYATATRVNVGAPYSSSYSSSDEDRAVKRRRQEDPSPPKVDPIPLPSQLGLQESTGISRKSAQSITNGSGRRNAFISSDSSSSPTGSRSGRSSISSGSSGIVVVNFSPSKSTAGDTATAASVAKSAESTTGVTVNDTNSAKLTEQINTTGTGYMNPRGNIREFFSSSLSPSTSEDEEEEDDNDDDPMSLQLKDKQEKEQSYVVESILGHSKSDPRTHIGIGKEPVMLYHVKWVGYTETTWEPIASFADDMSVVNAYWVGVEENRARAEARQKQRQKQKQQQQQQQQQSQANEKQPMSEI